MQELVRTNDLVLISWLQAAMEAAGIELTVFDQYASAADGSINAVPRRLMVSDADFERARRILNAGESGAAS